MFKASKISKLTKILLCASASFVALGAATVLAVSCGNNKAPEDPVKPEVFTLYNTPHEVLKMLGIPENTPPDKFMYLSIDGSAFFNPDVTPGFAIGQKEIYDTFANYKINENFADIPERINNIHTYNEMAKSIKIKWTFEKYDKEVIVYYFYDDSFIYNPGDDSKNVPKLYANAGGKYTTPGEYEIPPLNPTYKEIDFLNLNLELGVPSDKDHDKQEFVSIDNKMFMDKVNSNNFSPEEWALINKFDDYSELEVLTDDNPERANLIIKYNALCKRIITKTTYKANNKAVIHYRFIKPDYVYGRGHKIYSMVCEVKV